MSKNDIHIIKKSLTKVKLFIYLIFSDANNRAGTGSRPYRDDILYGQPPVAALCCACPMLMPLLLS